MEIRITSTVSVRHSQTAVILRRAVDRWLVGAPWLSTDALCLIGSDGIGQRRVRLYVDGDGSLWTCRGPSRPIYASDEVVVAVLGDELALRIAGALSSLATRRGVAL